MIKMRRLLALTLASVMACSCFAMAEAVTEADTEAEVSAPVERQGGNLVYATATFGQKFSPFFATTAYDM